LESFSRQCGLLIQSLELGTAQIQRPALAKATHLWLYFLSGHGSPDPSQDSTFLEAENAYQDARRYPSRVVETIQVAWLLSVLLLSIGRRREAAFYIGDAARMAQGDLVSGILADSDSAEGRIVMYWLTYYLDKVWSVSFTTPSLFPDVLDENSGINVPLPQRVGDYPFSIPAVRIMTSSLFERAYRLSRTPPSARGETFLTQFNELHSWIQELSREHPLSAINSADRHDKPALVAIQSVMHAAAIYLYLLFNQDDFNAWSVQAARRSVLIAQMAGVEHSLAGGEGWWFVDPVVDVSVVSPRYSFSVRLNISPSCAGLVLRISCCAKCKHHGLRRTGSRS
jgi:hypothetical protein